MQTTQAQMFIYSCRGTGLRAVSLLLIKDSTAIEIRYLAGLCQHTHVVLRDSARGFVSPMTFNVC